MYGVHSAAALVVYQQIKEIKCVIVLYVTYPKFLLVAYSLCGKEMVTLSFF